MPSRNPPTAALLAHLRRIWIYGFLAGFGVVLAILLIYLFIWGWPTIFKEGQEVGDKVTSSQPPTSSAAFPSTLFKTSEAEEKPVYLGSIRSNKYHYPDCKWAKTIQAKRIIRFKAVNEAKAKGYHSCPTCKPPLRD